ncbi:hypothetical protein DTO280E4_4338 [Paecilomyces variotii]|nr:hypothetical protein DTO169C6_8476 [Paecilomyces variotii]KAJ9360621.1 hypothetical protein DTO280E4_4338 [Paecilomyces variotii]
MGPPSFLHNDIPLRPSNQGAGEPLSRFQAGTGLGRVSTTVAGNAAYDGQSSLRRAHTVAQGPNTPKTNLGRRGKERAQSLLRVKNSAEMLWQRSTKRSNNVPESVPESSPTGREGKHFTVGNVGNNGRLYLRPIITPVQKGAPNPFSRSPINPSDSMLTAQDGFLDIERDARHSMWSISQLSELHPGLGNFGQPPHEQAPLAGDNRHKKSHSCSTIEERRSSSNERPGELRIVIDRSDDRPRSNEEKGVPTLEIPIPHYRLGRPQFNSEGSAALRSSAYTRTSVSDNFRESAVLEDEPSSNIPQPVSETGERNERHSFGYGRPLSFTTSMFSGAVALSRNSASHHSVFYKLKEPIEPFIFDGLAVTMDDPSVVRYLPGTKDISAATPARIVAQITSESFMDYELVSDFFLTFRSYLSSSNLLSLLLARLQWAINRLQDDGRIIRIRAFAALRHWILNYFADDFVLDRDLRVQFCDRINSMYDAVKDRDVRSTSDLKILVDLKRCWNGRCSVYWDMPDSAPDNNLDSPVVPGGVVGSRDINKTSLDDIEELFFDSTLLHELPEGHYCQSVHPKTTTNQSQPTQTSHSRNASATTARDTAVSPSDGNSVQVVSCSFPSITPKRSSSSDVSNVSIPHPVPVLTTNLPSSPGDHKSPIAPHRRPVHAHFHKRSGSFSDSVRDDRAPLRMGSNDAQGQSFMTLAPYASGLIRGNLFGPSDPRIEGVSPPSPTFFAPSTDVSHAVSHDSPDVPKPTGSSQGVRTIIGSIRRVLNSRQGSQWPLTQSRSLSPMPPLRGRTSTLPMNVAFGSELYKNRKSSAVGKCSLRVDLLCDDVLKQYRDAVGYSAEKDIQESGATAPAHANDTKEPALQPGSQMLQAEGHDTDTRHSLVTMGSKSIVIVDDTGVDIPVMSGAVPPTSASTQQGQGQHMRSGHSDATSKTINLDRAWYSSGQADEYAAPLQYRGSGSDAASKTSRYSGGSELFAPRSSLSSIRRLSGWRKSGSMSNRLRKYASYQSVVSRYRHEVDNDVASSASGETDAQGDYEKPYARLLRRRPGGDLRKVQNIHDLESLPRPHSFQSGTSRTESLSASTTGTRSHTFGSQQTFPQRQRFSLIETHSSQNMRPSFEAVVAEFSHIPDDDDGGVESALLKLEGKWNDSSTDTGGSPMRPERGEAPSSESEWTHNQTHSGLASNQESFIEQRHTLSEGNSSHTVLDQPSVHGPYSESVAESEDSYCSIPLLERGLSDESMKKPPLRPVKHVVTAHKQSSSDTRQDTHEPESSHPSIDVVEETESLRRIPRGSTIPSSPAAVYVKEEDCLSELSSEISVDIIDPEEAVEKPHRLPSTGSHGQTISALEIPPHPLAHPPSPPMTIQQPNSRVSLPEISHPLSFQSKPLTPDPSPTHKNAGGGNDRAIDFNQLSSNVILNSERGDAKMNPTDLMAAAHIPFILAYDSQLIAEQLTIVEQAALSEIDWKDLVDMRWSGNSPVSLSWVQFLSEQDKKGIDLVVGRFNLMVKWVLSEIILTQDLQERVRVITKFIHIAAHARRICNYSTMLQITIALSSIDCTRLRRTWELVAAQDKDLLREMESLIQPVRNFHELRVEMETANLQEGCVPFVGLYVHDLTYNAQKPAQIASTRDGDPLVNFERYRTAAKIIKSLLRLIDASTKYAFEPACGVIERCLWIAALPDDQIQMRSSKLD